MLEKLELSWTRSVLELNWPEKKIELLNSAEKSIVVLLIFEFVHLNRRPSAFLNFPAVDGRPLLWLPLVSTKFGPYEALLSLIPNAKIMALSVPTV